MTSSSVQSALKAPLIDGSTISVRRHGNPNGPRILMGHGVGLAIDAYERFWSRFTEDFDIVVFDMRNHGLNELTDLDSYEMPTHVEDLRCVVSEIAGLWGEKELHGVCHSFSAVAALLLDASESTFSSLVAIDPPLGPPNLDEAQIKRLITMGNLMERVALRRKASFASVDEYVANLRTTKIFALLPDDALESLAAATLREDDDTDQFLLRCPPKYEAKMYKQLFHWSPQVNFDKINCPVKVIGADPTLNYSFLPSLDLAEITRIEYDFVPDSTHLLQLESPDPAADLTLDFLARQIAN